MTPTRTLLATAVALALPIAPALASSFAGTSAGASSAGASNSSSSSGDDKVVLQAREDAAVFVASDGAVRSAHLEAALRALRERGGDARASDLQLARAILAR